MKFLDLAQFLALLEDVIIYPVGDSGGVLIRELLVLSRTLEQTNG